METLKRWLLCLAGKHDWAQLQLHDGPTIVLCLVCGVRAKED